MLRKPIPIHLKVFPDRIEVINLLTGDRSENESQNGFTSARLLVADFEAAEAVALEALNKLPGTGNSMLKRSYLVLIQAMDMYDGGLSSVELRTYRDLGEMIGGRMVFIADGSKEFSEQEALDLLKSL